MKRRITEEHKARLMENLNKARQKYAQMRFRRPGKGTEAYRAYCKLRDILGPDKARREMDLPAAL